MTSCPFVDTNVFLRYLLADHEQHSAASVALMRDVATEARCVTTSATVIFETMFTLTQTYRIDRDDAAREVRSILELDALPIPDKRQLRMAFDLFEAHRKLSFADCYHAALAFSSCGGEIYTFDKEFDRVPNLTRIELGA